jgi:hypothetical protein
MPYVTIAFGRWCELAQHIQLAVDCSLTPCFLLAYFQQQVAVWFSSQRMKLPLLQCTILPTNTCPSRMLSLTRFFRQLGKHFEEKYV